VVARNKEGGGSEKVKEGILNFLGKRKGVGSLSREFIKKRFCTKRMYGGSCMGKERPKSKKNSGECLKSMGTGGGGLAPHFLFAKRCRGNMKSGKNWWKGVWGEKGEGKQSGGHLGGKGTLYHGINRSPSKDVDLVVIADQK